MQCLAGYDCGSLPDWIIAATAVFALGLAYFQLRGLRDSLKFAAEATNASADAARSAAKEAETSAKAADANLLIAKATLMLEIDRQFESPELYRSRKAIRAMRQRASDAINNPKPKDNSEGNVQHLQKVEISHQMNLLWERANKFDDIDVDNPKSADVVATDRYAELLTLPNWIETIGLLCKQQLLPKKEILELYDAVIIPTMNGLELHIEKRRDEKPYPNPRWMENALWLRDEAIVYKKEREKPVLTSPAPANLFS